MPVPSQGHCVFIVYRLLTDFVCLYNYEFWLSLCKIVRSSIILLLPLCITANTFTGLDCMIWVTWRVSYQRQDLLTLRGHLRSSRLFGRVRVAHLFNFCVVLLCVFTFLDPGCDLSYNFSIKTMFVCFYLQLFVWVLMSYLRYFCFFLCIAVSNTYCVVFTNVYSIYIHKHGLLYNEKKVTSKWTSKG